MSKETTPAVVISSNGTALLPSVGAAISHSKEYGAKPSAPKLEESSTMSNGKIYYWGTDNSFPNDLIELGQKSTIVAPTIEKKINFLYGKGVQPYRVVDVAADGEEVLQAMTPESDPAIFEWMERSNLKRYILEAATDFYWFQNIFPEIILSRDRKQIAQLVCQEAIHCRWEIIPKGERRPLHCYISGKWQDNTQDSIEKVPTLNPYDPYRWEQLAADKDYKYIYPLSYPTPGKTYYQMPTWYAAKKAGWLDIAQSIPEWKKALMANQISVKYMIRVPDYWWKWKYPNWDTKTNEEKVEAMQTEYQKIETFLSGSDNAGKTIMTTFKYDEHLKKEYPGWTIEPIQDMVQDGTYLEDSQEASVHLLYALGVDPTLMGFSPGKNHTSSGSGSDKRVAFNMYLESIEPHRDIILEPLYFISRYNNWGPDIRWRFKYTRIHTLNTGQETSTITQ